MNRSLYGFKYGRRRSRSIGSVLSNELCQMIPKDISPEERLELLVKYALDNTFDILEREILEDLDTDSFTVTVTDCKEKILSTVKERNIYSQVTCHKEEGENSSFQENYMEFKNEVEKVETEIKKWDDIHLKYKNAAINGTKISSPFSTQLLQNERLASNGSLPDYTSLLAEFKEELEEIEKRKLFLTSCVKLNNRLIKTLAAESQKKFSVDLNETPRTLIKKCYD